MRRILLSIGVAVGFGERRRAGLSWMQPFDDPADRREPSYDVRCSGCAGQVARKPAVILAPYLKRASETLGSMAN
jgi:hypothetical protein